MTSPTTPGAWQASNDLESQPATLAHPATFPMSTSEREGHVLATERPETGDSRAELRPSPSNIAGSGPATATQGVLRRRSSRGAHRDPATAEESRETERPKKSRTFFKHITPKEPFTVRNQIQRTLFNSWINILLLSAPVGIAINYIPSVSRLAVFIVNFVAIVPLAAMLGFATEEIALRTGETMGGLLNATFG